MDGRRGARRPSSGPVRKGGRPAGFAGARRCSDDSKVLPSSLTVSIVTYRSDAVLLERCLDHLAVAIRTAREEGVLTQVAVALIDNSEDAALAGEGIRLAKRAFTDSGVQLHFLNGHLNVCYAVAHNLMLSGRGGDYQLVHNPDVEVAPGTLASAIRWLDANP